MVLTETKWMGESKLTGIGGLAGWVPVDMESKDTVFVWKLFPVETDKGWTIYFRLTGAGQTKYPEREVSDALAFLRGEATIFGRPNIEEFALCEYQEHGSKVRIERFGRKGICVYKWPP